MAEEKRELSAEIQSFLRLVQENISLYPETIVYNRIIDHISNMTARQIAWLTSTIIISTEFRVRIFKKRCDTGDDLACDMLGLSVNGDPYSKNPTVRKGLIGLWHEDHDIEAAKLLVEIGKLSQEDLDQTLKTGRDKEMIAGRTREDALCELAEEAREYKSGDEFSMAMIMGRLKSVPEPNTANVKKIIQGKYKSGEEFWMGVQNGDLDETCKRVKEEKEIVEIAKRKEVIKPELAIPPRPPAMPMAPMPMEEVKQVIQVKKEADLDKRIEELRKKKELEKQRQLEKEKTKAIYPSLPAAAHAVPQTVPELDLMKDEIERRIAEMMRRKRAGEGQAGEPAARYDAKKKDLKVLRTTLLQVTGTEARYSGSQYVKTPVSISIEQDPYNKFIIYRKGQGKEVSTSFHAKTYTNIYVLRYQGAFGYTIELGFTDEKNNAIKIMLDPAPGNVINGIIFENERKIAEFDVDEASFRKAELFAREKNIIKESSGENIQTCVVCKKKFAAVDDEHLENGEYICSARCYKKRKGG